MITGTLTWVSIPNDYDQLYSNLDNSLSKTAIALSFATNATTTMMIAYKLWYVIVGGIQWSSGSQ